MNAAGDRGESADNSRENTKTAGTEQQILHPHNIMVSLEFIQTP